MAHHLVEDIADRHVALRGVRLAEQPLLPAPFAGDAQESRRECGERLVQRLGARRQRVVAVAAPVASGDGPAHLRVRVLTASTRYRPTGNRSQMRTRWRQIPTRSGGDGSLEQDGRGRVGVGGAGRVGSYSGGSWFRGASWGLWHRVHPAAHCLVGLRSTLP
jgi:hypothetical protein